MYTYRTHIDTHEKTKNPQKTKTKHTLVNTYWYLSEQIYKVHRWSEVLVKSPEQKTVSIGHMRGGGCHSPYPTVTSLFTHTLQV